MGAVITLCVSSVVLTVFRDIGISMIFNLDAFLIVIGGTIIALFVGFPAERIRNTINDVINSYKNRTDRDVITGNILEISRMYMKTNIRSLEEKMKNIDDDFLKLGLKLLINDYGSHDIRNIMEREMMIRIINRNFSLNLLRTVARLTPSFGLAGTVISLIKMFRHLDSVDAIAPMMSVALMSTFYGIIIANVIMLPLCAKLKEEAIESEAIMNICIDGILAIKHMEHPLRIEERIRGFREDPAALSAGMHGRVTTAKASGTA